MCDAKEGLEALGRGLGAWRAADVDGALGAGWREAGEIGFEGIEKGRKMPAEPAALRAALEPHGLVLVSGRHSLRLLERSVDVEKAATAPHLHLLREMGCEVCILCETTRTVHGDPGAPLSARDNRVQQLEPGHNGRTAPCTSPG